VIRLERDFFGSLSRERVNANLVQPASVRGPGRLAKQNQYGGVAMQELSRRTGQRLRVLKGSVSVAPLEGRGRFVNCSALGNGT